MNRLAHKRRADELSRPSEYNSNNVFVATGLEELGVFIDREASTVKATDRIEHDLSYDVGIASSLHDRQLDQQLADIESTVFDRASDLASLWLKKGRRDKATPSAAETIVISAPTAWVDNEIDEAMTAVNREKMKELIGQPDWATSKKMKSKRLPDKIHSDSEDEQEAELSWRNYSSKNNGTSAGPLAATSLDFVRCADLNAEGRSFARVSAVKFHPTARIALVASHDATLRLFQVDGGSKNVSHSNPLLHAVCLKQWPIEQAEFDTTNQQIFLQSAIPRRGFYTYDMLGEKLSFHGRFRDLGCDGFKRMAVDSEAGLVALSTAGGYIHIISTKTKELIFSLRRGGQIGGLTFSRQDNGTAILLASGVNDAEVFAWDVRQQRKCLYRFEDSGGVNGGPIAASSNGSFLACGSQSGIVNLYNQNDCLTCKRPHPLKSFKNIVYPLSGLTFNASSELLFSFSSESKAIMRAAHVASKTVFANFPVPGEEGRLKYISSLAVSPGSGYLAVGNSRGRVALWRVSHYQNY